jgi:hypothetical protein
MYWPFIIARAFYPRRCEQEKCAGGRFLSQRDRDRPGSEWKERDSAAEGRLRAPSTRAASTSMGRQKREAPEAACEGVGRATVPETSPPPVRSSLKRWPLRMRSEGRSTIIEP